MASPVSLISFESLGSPLTPGKCDLCKEPLFNTDWPSWADRLLVNGHLHSFNILEPQWHRFHRICLDQFFQQQKRCYCPTCHQPSKPIEITREEEGNAFISAARNGNIDGLKKLLHSYSTDPSVIGEAMIIAIQFKQYDIIDFLLPLSKGMSIEHRGQAVIEAAKRDLLAHLTRVLDSGKISITHKNEALEISKDNVGIQAVLNVFSQTT